MVLIKSSNCIGKQAFKSALNIERTKWRLEGEALDNMSRSPLGKATWAREQYIYKKTESVSWLC